MAKGVYTLASLAGGSAGVVLGVCALSLAVACERIRPSERPSPPASAPENRELAREAEALVHVSGTVVSDAVLGTHELALTVVNRSRWTLTELRVAVEFDPGREATLQGVRAAHSGRGRPRSNRRRSWPGSTATRAMDGRRPGASWAPSAIPPGPEFARPAHRSGSRHLLGPVLADGDSPLPPGTFASVVDLEHALHRPRVAGQLHVASTGDRGAAARAFQAHRSFPVGEGRPHFLRGQ